MVYAAGSDPLCYPGTTVLRNLLGIEDRDRLDEVELALFLTRAEEPFPPGDFDVPHYLGLHRHLFQDVYAWAGEVRSVRIGKDGNWFCYPEYIEPELNRVFTEFGRIWDLQLIKPADFARHIGHFLAEPNAVHPFREGNGRTQFAFLAMLADRSGLPFNHNELDRQRVMKAMISSFSGDETQLVALLLDVVS